MHFKLIESYERYRNIFENEEIEIALDEYPFGLALEIESKNNREETIQKIIEQLVWGNFCIINSYIPQFRFH